MFDLHDALRDLGVVTHDDDETLVIPIAGGGASLLNTKISQLVDWSSACRVGGGGGGRGMGDGVDGGMGGVRWEQHLQCAAARPDDRADLFLFRADLFPHEWLGVRRSTEQVRGLLVVSTRT